MVATKERVRAKSRAAPSRNGKRDEDADYMNVEHKAGVGAGLRALRHYLNAGIRWRKKRAELLGDRKPTDPRSPVGRWVRENLTFSRPTADRYARFAAMAEARGLKPDFKPEEYELVEGLWAESRPAPAEKAGGGKKGGKGGKETAGTGTAADPHVPREWDVVKYRPADPETGRDAKEPVDCDVRSVDEKAKTVTLRDLGEPERTYPGVPWDALEYEGGEGGGGTGGGGDKEAVKGEGEEGGPADDPPAGMNWPVWVLAAGDAGYFARVDRVARRLGVPVDDSPARTHFGPTVDKALEFADPGEEGAAGG